MSHIPFLDKLNPSPVRDLLTLQKTDVPWAPGVYVLVSDDETKFRYPHGSSSVFYIGQSTRLRKRLRRHKHMILAKDQYRKKGIYRPVPEYGAAFGVKFTFMLADDAMHPKGLEDTLLAKFAVIYRSLPVANGAAGWKRIRHLINIVR